MDTDSVLVESNAHLSSNITVVSQKRAHGQCTIHWAQIGGGLTFQASILCTMKRAKQCI